jgi:hypothetical protein
VAVIPMGWEWSTGSEDKLFEERFHERSWDKS